MNAQLLGALSGAGVVGAIFLVVWGFRGRPIDVRVRPRTPQRSLAQRWTRFTRRPAGAAGRRRDLLLAGVAVITLGATLVTGWLVLLILVPVALLLVPWLLAAPNKVSIERSAALEQWVRSLRSLLQGGADNTLEAALRASLTSAPAAIRPQVSNLVNRIQARWSIDRALAEFADDLDDPAGDMVAASLMLASRRRSGGLTTVLDGLTEYFSDEVQARRRIESERAQPRVAARVLTVLFAGFGLVMAVANPAFLAPYRTPLGQVLLAVIIGMFVAILFMIRRITTDRDKPRIYPRPDLTLDGGNRRAR